MKSDRHEERIALCCSAVGWAKAGPAAASANAPRTAARHGGVPDRALIMKILSSLTVAKTSALPPFVIRKNWP